MLFVNSFRGSNQVGSVSMHQSKVPTVSLNFSLWLAYFASKCSVEILPSAPLCTDSGAYLRSAWPRGLFLFPREGRSLAWHVALAAWQCWTVINTECMTRKAHERNDANRLVEATVNRATCGSVSGIVETGGGGTPSLVLKGTPVGLNKVKLR